MNTETATQKLVKMANGEAQNPEEESVFKRLLAMLFSPGVQNLAAGEDVNNVMGKRKMMMGQQPTGGAFDLIYRSKKEREDAMRELLNQ
jgi:hypothetical protein